MEVDIDHGKISPRGSTPLPDKAAGLLTILPATPSTPQAGAFLQNLESLQKQLQLDAAGAKKWMGTVSVARR
ncbi:hypothetical protein D3C83_211040 [compost metagenome]